MINNKITSAVNVLVIAIVTLFAACHKNSPPPAPIPNMNRLALSIDNGPEMAFEGPIVPTVCAHPGCTTPLSAQVHELDYYEHRRPTGIDIWLETPFGTDGFSRTLNFQFQTFREGISHFSDQHDLGHLTEDTLTQPNAPRSWSVYSGSPSSTKKLSISYDPETNYFNGEFDIVFCVDMAIATNSCTLTENRKHLRGVFRIKRNTTPNNLYNGKRGTSPGDAIELGKPPTIAGKIIDSNVTTYYSVTVTQGIPYLISAATDTLRPVTGPLKIHVFDDDQFSHEICTSKWPSRTNECVVTPQSSVLYVRVDRPQNSKRYLSILLTITEDMSNAPALRSYDAHVESTTRITPSAWNMIYRYPVVPGEIYKVNLSNANGFFPQPRTVIFGQDISVDPNLETRLCAAPDAPECKIDTDTIDTWKCELSLSNHRECSVRAKGNVLVVMTSFAKNMGGSLYDLSVSLENRRYYSQGALDAPIEIDTTPLIGAAHIEGEVNQLPSFYQLKLDANSTYMLSVFGENNVSLPWTLYNSPPQIGNCSNNCRIIPNSNLLNLRVTSGPDGIGGRFTIYLWKVNAQHSGYKSQSLSLMEMENYQSDVELESAYSFPTTPGSIYKVTLTQSDGDFERATFNISNLSNTTNPTDFICRGVYQTYKGSHCEFMALESMYTIRVTKEHYNLVAPYPSKIQFTLNIVQDNSLMLPVSEGSLQNPVAVTLNSSYSGKANSQGSHYAISVEPNQDYLLSIQNNSAGTWYSFEGLEPDMLLGSSCWGHTHLFTLPDCHIRTGANQNTMQIKIEPNVYTQSTEYTFTLRKDAE